MDRVELIERNKPGGGFDSCTLWLVQDGELVQVRRNEWYPLPWSSDFLYRTHSYFLDDRGENHRVIGEVTRKYGYPSLWPYGLRSRASILLRDFDGRGKRVRAEIGVLANSDFELKLIITPDGVHKEAITIPTPEGGRKELTTIHR